MKKRTKIRKPNANDYKAMFEASCVLADKWKAEADSLSEQLSDMASFFFKNWPKEHREALRNAINNRKNKQVPF